MSGVPDTIDLSTDHPIWERFFFPAPLVLVGTLEPDDSPDIAPKHMVVPMGWQNYIGFVCTPRHSTYRNARDRGGFTMSFPRPGQLVSTSLAASPRLAEGEKPAIEALETFAARRVAGALVRDCYLYLECELHQVVDGFGVNSLLVGNIVAAYADPSFLRDAEKDDLDLIAECPLLVYLQPGRCAEIRQSFSFPFPKGMKK